MIRAIVPVLVPRVKMGGTRFAYVSPDERPSGHNRFRSMRFPRRHGATGSELRQCFVRSAPIAVGQAL
jgi:hypothetical protein